MPTYHVENFGCRATQADGAALELQFEARGLNRAAANHADVVILNTCTVTNSADQDARAAIRRVKRQNPAAKIVVTGCYAQRAPEEIAALPGVTAVIGNSHKHQLAEIVLDKIVLDNISETSCEAFGWRSASSAAVRTAESSPALAAEVAGASTTLLPVSAVTGNWQLATGSSIHVSDIFAHTELLAAPVFESTTRTRPNLKVQDGCNNRCSFCVIPSVRGQSRSLPPEKVIAEVNTLVAAGYRELVISGINLGRWGKDLHANHQSPPSQRQTTNGQRLASLIQAILNQTSLQKLRISSVEPMDWTNELIALVAESQRIARHAHVPLQSGSDAVLRRMHRKYRPWHYREKIEKIRAAMPTTAIGADVMVGFPGETDAEFEQTRRLIDDLPFTYLHVFTYSARPGTPAASMPNQVPIHIARERNKVLRDLAAEKKQTFMRTFIGRTIEAITLGSRDADVSAREAGIQQTFTEALTDNYQKLLLKGTHAPNQWLRARVEDIQHESFIGSIS